jgi:hypothetical protein
MHEGVRFPRLRRNRPWPPALRTGDCAKPLRSPGYGGQAFPVAGRLTTRRGLIKWRASQSGGKYGIRRRSNIYSWGAMPTERRRYLTYSPELADRVVAHDRW